MKINNTSKTIITCFAGRKEYMEIQVQYIIKLLNKYDFIESYDIWDFSWSEIDSKYLNTLTSLHPKIKIRQAPDYGKATRASPTGSKQYAYFFNQGYDSDAYKDYIFVKVDDDVLYIDIDNFGFFIEQRKQNAHHFLVSANVVNNNFDIIDASSIHEDFLKSISNLSSDENDKKTIEYPNTSRLSINFCSWLGKDLPLIVEEFSDGIGFNDEWRMCHVIPSKINKNNLIIKSYKVSHFSFGTQSFDKNTFLKKYKALRDTL